MALSDWDDHLTRWLVDPPFTDAAGRKGWLERFCYAQPHRTQKLAFEISGWPQLSPPLRVAFLADFHVGSHSDDCARLGAIIEQVKAFQPDLALYGGDFVNMIPFGGGRVPPDVIAGLLSGLQPPLGAFAVLGNHDRNYGGADVAHALERHGIRVLDDERLTLQHDDLRLEVVGIPDARQERTKATALLQELSAETPALILAHDPVWFRHVPAGPHLVLAGHTHGGQIRLPLLGPIRNASQAPLRWSYGLIEEDGRRMYVTSGLGCSGVPVRIGMRPEFVIVDLTGSEPTTALARGSVYSETAIR